MTNTPRSTLWTARLARLGERLPTKAKLMGGVAQGLMSAAAAILAYLPTKPLGLHEGFWGSITAIAVVQSELSATQTSARDQFAGAAIGALISGLIVTLAGQHLLAYAAAVVLCMVMCWVRDAPAHLGNSRQYHPNGRALVRDQ